MDSGEEGKIYIQIRPYALYELAALYKVCKKTFKKWIKPFKDEIGKRNGRFYSIAQVQIIFKRLLLPSRIEINKEL